MFTQSTANDIKKFLGKNYSKKILDYLKANKIKRLNGTDYIRQDIYNLFSGKRTNDALEDAVISCVDHYKQERLKMANKLKRLLN